MYYTLDQLKSWLDEYSSIRSGETPIVAFFLTAEDIEIKHPDTGEYLRPTEIQQHAIMKEIGNNTQLEQQMNDYKEHAVFRYTGY